MTKKTFEGKSFTIKGIITSKSLLQTPEIIGSFYGQTRGILGEKLDLETIYKNGQLGRIDIKSISSKKYEFNIPTALTIVDCSLIAASLESIEIIGGSPCEIEITEISNNAEEKRKTIYKRAKELLTKFNTQVTAPVSFSQSEIIEYIPSVCFGSKDVLTLDSIILVEGRADVRKLHTFGFNNVISTNGYNSPKELFTLIKGKYCTAFMDGDSVGKKIVDALIKKKVLREYTFAPKGKAVEEINKTQVVYALKHTKKVKLNLKLEKKVNKVSKVTKTKEVKSKPVKKVIKKEKEMVLSKANEIVKVTKVKKPMGKNCFTKKEFEIISKYLPLVEGSSKFIVLNKHLSKIQEEKISSIGNKKLEEGKFLFFDGIYEKSMDNKMKEKSFEAVICKRKSNLQQTAQAVLTYKKIKDSLES